MGHFDGARSLTWLETFIKISWNGLKRLPIDKNEIRVARALVVNVEGCLLELLQVLNLVVLDGPSAPDHHLCEHFAQKARLVLSGVLLHKLLDHLVL